MQDSWNPTSVPLPGVDESSMKAWAVSGAYAEESNGLRHRPRNGDWIDDRFQIVGRPLGKGDLGMVYKVCDQDGQWYALKRLSPGLGRNRQVKDRILADFEELHELRHPHLTSYYELFEADGALYLLMELIDGISLQRLLQLEQTLPVELATWITQGVLQALEYLHIHQVLHHEVKPENILLGRDGSVKLTDYGLRWVEYSTFSQSRNPLQTPHYMSPEQLRTRKPGEELGPESDLYSLGTVLYEMLCGDNPYGLTSEMTMRELIRVKQTGTPRPLAETFPASLRKLIHQLLEHKPHKRLSDTRVVSQLLMPHSPRPVRAQDRLGQWVEIHRDPLSDASLERQKRRRQRQEQVFSAPTQPVELPEEVVAPAEGNELLPFFLLSCLFFAGLFLAGVFLQEQPGLARENRKSAAPAAKSSLLPAPTPRKVFGSVQAKKVGKKKFRKSRRRWKRKRRRRYRRRWKRKRRWKKRRYRRKRRRRSSR